jgi:hypothetical protein
MRSEVKPENNSDMKKMILLGLLYAVTLVLMVLPSLGHAKTVKRVAGNAAAKLSTSMAFSGSRVGGQYQLPSESTAKIENEKPIEELLGLRTQFRDRMKLDEERK